MKILIIGVIIYLVLSNLVWMFICWKAIYVLRYDNKALGELGSELADKIYSKEGLQKLNERSE